MPMLYLVAGLRLFLGVHSTRVFADGGRSRTRARMGRCALLTLRAFVLLAAACVPANRIKARQHHAVVLGVKLWALAHLPASGMPADAVPFGSFVVWAVALLGVAPFG